MLNNELRNLLERERPVHLSEIRHLYLELDSRFHLKASRVPVVLGYDEAKLGAYTRASWEENEHFFFSLLFIGYCLKHPLSKEDRLDLYRHEYAHYMQYHMEIPKEYTWQSGTHGSAWKYCCSLVGCAPTPYYRAGERMLKQQEYDRLLKNPIHDKTVPLRDRYKQKQVYEQQKESIAVFKPGDTVMHPKFGQGIVEEVKPASSSVHLTIRFSEDVKIIDQKWLKRAAYKRKG